MQDNNQSDPNSLDLTESQEEALAEIEAILRTHTLYNLRGVPLLVAGVARLLACRLDYDTTHTTPEDSLENYLSTGEGPKEITSLQVACTDNMDLSVVLSAQIVHTTPNATLH